MRTDQKTKEILKYCAEIQNKSCAGFLRELAMYFLEIYGSMKSANTTYTIIGNNLTLEVSGKSRLVSGSFPMPTEASSEEVDAEVKKLVERGFEELGETN